MKIAVMQPYFMPYLGYFQLIHSVDNFVIYDDVNYINRGWINRNRILVNGRDQLVTLRLVKASQNKLIRDITVVNESVNRDNLFKTICSNYKKAPFYNVTVSLLEDVILNVSERLSDYLEYGLKSISKYLQIDTKFIKSSDIKKDDLLRGQEKIIEITSKLGADTYINAIGGRELYNKKVFDECGITLKFIKSGHLSYHQFKEPFVRDLSIVDVLMFNPRDVVKQFLNNYELV